MNSMSTLRALFPVALMLTLLACRPTAGARVQADLQLFQREQSAEKLWERGQAFAAVGDTTRAQEYLAAALEAGGNQVKILPLLLAVCVRDGRYRLAVEYVERYLERHPADGRMRFVLGTIYLALGEPEPAERAFRRVAHAERNNPDVEYALALLMRDHKADEPAAAQHFQEYLRLAPDGEHAAEARASLVAGAP